MEDRRIKVILESITDAFFALDREWRYTYLNDLALRRIQRAKGEELTREELLGKNCWEVFPETVGTTFEQELHRALREQRTVHFEEYSPPADGWVGVHAYPSEEGLAIYVQDITERKRVEERLEEIREEERSRMARDLHDEALQEIADAMAQALLMQTRPEEAQGRLEQLSETLGRAERSVRAAIYDLSLGGERERPFSELLEGLLDLHRSMAPELEISLDVSDGGVLEGPLGKVGKELVRIIGEALTNTRRHSGASSVLVSAHIREGRLYAEVSDNGQGFDPASVGSATAERGVGLNSMRERAHAIGATLNVQSEPEIGTRVIFELDLRQEIAEAEQG